MHALLVSMTPVRSFLPVSLTPGKLSKTVKVSLTGVVDTGKELFTGVNDTGEAPKLSNISTNIRKKSKSLLGLSTGARRSCLKKKTRGKKSRGTVPLRAPWKNKSKEGSVCLRGVVMPDRRLL
jgi:hypothetical protein